MSSLRSLFQFVEALPTSVMIRESLYGYTILLTTHVVSMCLFAGLIAMMDLRLAGWAYRDAPVSQVQKRLFPWQMFGMAVSSVTGLLIFYGQPMRYYGKVFFWAKMLLMLGAGLNAYIFHVTTYKSVAQWDSSAMPPARAKLAGDIGLVLWGLVIVFGKLTAYNWLTYSR